jgi:cholesterol transport system auxiliary component
MSKFLLDRRTLFVAGASSLALSACSDLIGPPAASPLYMLRPRMPAAGTGRGVNWQISIQLPEAPQSLDTDRIAIVQPGDIMDYYANAVWQDRLPFLVQQALVEAFEANNRITAVGRDTDILRSDYLLQTDIRDFQARYDVADTPPTAEVRIAAKLIAAHGRTITQITTVHKEVPTQQNSVPAATQAMNEALSQALADIVSWTLSAPQPPHGL